MPFNAAHSFKGSWHIHMQNGNLLKHSSMYGWMPLLTPSLTMCAHGNHPSYGAMAV